MNRQFGAFIDKFIYIHDKKFSSTPMLLEEETDDFLIGMEAFPSVVNRRDIAFPKNEVRNIISSRTVEEEIEFIKATRTQYPEDFQPKIDSMLRRLKAAAERNRMKETKKSKVLLADKHTSLADMRNDKVNFPKANSTLEI